jgi:hypothetical protein
MSRSHSIAAVVSFAVLAAPLALGLAGCDQLNKPIGHPSGGSSSGSANTMSGDGGDLATEGGAWPAPSITAQPGDIQL